MVRVCFSSSVTYNHIVTKVCKKGAKYSIYTLQGTDRYELWFDLNDLADYMGVNAFKMINMLPNRFVDYISRDGSNLFPINKNDPNEIIKLRTVLQLEYHINVRFMVNQLGLAILCAIYKQSPSALIILNIVHKMPLDILENLMTYIHDQFVDHLEKKKPSITVFYKNILKTDCYYYLYMFFSPDPITSKSSLLTSRSIISSLVL